MAYMNQERKAALAPAIMAICKEYGIKATLAVRHHSTLILNVKSGPIDFMGQYNETGRKNREENPCHGEWQDATTCDIYPPHYLGDAYRGSKSFSGKALEFLHKVSTAMHRGNWDKSDLQTDYFDVGWYTEINIGISHDRPYILHAEGEEPEKKPLPKWPILTVRKDRSGGSYCTLTNDISGKDDAWPVDYSVKKHGRRCVEKLQALGYQAHYNGWSTVIVTASPWSPPAEEKPSTVAKTATVETTHEQQTIVEHTTKRGKTLRGTIRTDLDKAGAMAIDLYTFRKNGGWFIREKYLERIEPVESTPALEVSKTIPTLEVAKRLSKSQAMKKHEKAIDCKGVDGVKLAYATKESVLDFWNDIKNLSWPATYGESPWNGLLTSCAYYLHENTDPRETNIYYKEVVELLRFYRGDNDGNTGKEDQQPTANEPLAQWASEHATRPHIKETAQAVIATTAKATTDCPVISRWSNVMPIGAVRSTAPTPARSDMPPVIMFQVDESPAAVRHSPTTAEVVEPLEPSRPVIVAKNQEATEQPELPKNINPALEVVPQPQPRVRSCFPPISDLPEKDEQFYPTPPDLARDMVYKIKGHPRTILDPSAGKGDLLQSIKDGYTHRDAALHAIEIDNNLRAVLQSKKFTVLDSDFLAWSGPDKFDCIIMNPPFKHGAEHLLKAIDIMYSGQIICLLNAETLRNPCTNTRKDLVRRLAELGAKIEYKENRFLGAERSTSVDVALVDITIERRVEDDLFAGTTGTAGTDCNEQVRDEYAVSNKKTIEEMVASFREVVTLTTETIVNFYRHHNKVGRYVGLNEEPKTTWRPEKGNELTNMLQAVVNSTVRKIRVDYWRRTLELPEVRERLTQKRRAEFEEKLKANDTMDFTESNIRQFLLNLIDGYSKTLQDGVDEVFDLMTQRHCYDDKLRTENIHYFNGWKTNSAYRVGQKVILPIRSSYGSPFTGYSGWNLDWNAERTLSDIDLVMSYFNGGVEYVRLTDAINKAFAKNEQSGQSTFFKFKCHQKGTIHLTFLDENILRRFNVAACMGKGFIPGDYGKKKWRDMSNNEQEVAESFEPKGERSYTAHQGQPLFDATINPAKLLEEA